MFLVATGVLGIAGSCYLAARLASPEQPIPSSAPSPNSAASTTGLKIRRLPSKLFPREQIQIHTEQMEKQRKVIEGGHRNEALPNTEPVEIIKTK